MRICATLLLAPTLRSRLSFLVLAVALPLMALAVAAMLDAYQGERTRAQERLREQARALGAVIDNEFRGVEAVLTTLGVSEAIQKGDLDRFEGEMRAASGVLNGLAIVLADARGIERLSTQWAPGERRPGIPANEAMQRVLRTGRAVISAVHIGNVSRRPVISVAVPVTPAGGSAADPPPFVLSSALPSARLGETLRRTGWPEGWVVGAIDADEHLAARSVDFDRYYDTPILPQFHAALRHADAGLIRAVRVDGTPATIAFSRAPLSGYIAALAVPDEAFLGPLRRELWLTLVPAGLVFALGLTAALRMAQRLADAIQGLAQERSVPSRLREVQQVAERLDRIARERDVAEAGLRALAARLERQVAERTEALAESEARLRGIFDSQMSQVSLIDLQGRTLAANRALMQFRRATSEELIGVAVWETPWFRRNPAGAARLRDAVRRAAGGEDVRFELTTEGPGGAARLLDLSFHPIRHDQTGSVRLIVVEGYDITEMRSLESRLAQTSRLEALGQLAGGVAHDFNNVLQAVSGGMTMIVRRADDPQAVRRLAAMVQEAVGRGTSVTRRLLGFARRDELQARPVDAAALLTSMPEMLTHTLGAGIRVDVDAPPGLTPLLADPGQLETVLVNLATNARDAMPQGGTLRLSAAEEELESASAHGVPPGRYIRLSAADTGTGMDAATLARAMEPFFTTKPTGQGTGLGLAMARGFAQQSGGGLAIDSAPGQGTTVTLWLPQAAPGPPDVAISGGDGGDPGMAHARAPRADAPVLLLVEDSDLVRLPLRAMLESHGYVVLDAAGADAAMARLVASPSPSPSLAGGGGGGGGPPDPPPDRCPVDLLITDLSMPGPSGLDLISAARRRWPRLPAILLTGYAGEAADLAAEGSFVLLRKPVSDAELIGRVAALLATAR